MPPASGSVEDALGPILVNTFGERYLHAINGHAFERHGAATVFQDFFRKRLSQTNRLHIVVGTDSGLLLDYVATHPIPPGTRYVFIEFPEVMRALGLAVPATLAEQVALATPDTYGEALQRFSYTTYSCLDGIRLHRSLAATDASYAPYLPLSEAVETHLNQARLDLMTAVGGRHFTLPQIKNLAENRVPASVLRNRFRGATAVVLAGGPSLDDILPWVERHQERLIIIAVSRIARRLLATGITPHLIACIDPHAVSFDVSREALRYRGRCILVQAYHAVPSLVGQWGGMQVYLGPRLPWPAPTLEGSDEPILNDHDNLPLAGATVSHNAIHLAMEMGCSQIVLAGMDLCFSPNGHTHASASNESDIGPIVAAAGPRIRTNSGAMAETETTLLAGLPPLRQLAAAAEARGIRLINPAPGAAFVEKVLHLALADVSLPEQPVDPMRTLADAIGPDTAEERGRYFEAAQRALDQPLAELAVIEALAHEAAGCNDNFFGQSGQAGHPKLRKRMNAIEAELNERHRHLVGVLKVFGASHFIPFLRTTAPDTWTRTEAAELGTLYYNAFQLAARDLRHELEAARRRLQARLEEDKPAPDIALLLHQWETDAQPGRAAIWKAGHRTTYDGLSSEHRRAVDSLIDTFETGLQQSDTGHRRRTERLAGLAGLESKAERRFKERDVDDLRRLATVLQGRTGPEAQSYHHLLQGLVAELEHRNDAAVAEYSRVGEGPALESALRHLTGLLLEQGDLTNAVTALQCLSMVSAYYLPRYAEILRITGQTKDAVDVLTRYITLAPEDFNAMMRLGLLYKELGVTEGARWLFQHVSDHDPRNENARHLLRELETAP